MKTTSKPSPPPTGPGEKLDAERERIGACIRACADIADPERAVPMMVEALEKLIAAANCNYMRETMESEGYFDKARAALAQLERGEG